MSFQTFPSRTTTTRVIGFPTSPDKSAGVWSAGTWDDGEGGGVGEMGTRVCALAANGVSASTAASSGARPRAARRR
jgi:hypothetical protein